MVSCTEFIMAYNELFSYIDEHHGEESVRKFWEGISDNFLKNLRNLVSRKGIEGMKEYWTHTLTEERAKYDMTAAGDSFTIEMHECPSVGILRRNRHIKRYPKYCQHCDLLYRRVVEDYGFDYEIEYLDQEMGRCRVTIRKKREKNG